MHVNLNASTKRGGNKGRIYTSTDAPGAYRNTKAENNTKTTTVMVHAGQINETTTLPLPTEEEWRQATSEDHDLVYIKRVLSGPEETPIEPK